MKRQPIKHVIFDWSGVISDTFDNWYNTSSKIFEHFGHQKLSAKEARKNFTQPYMLFYNKYLPNLKLKEQQTIYSKIITKLPPAKIFPGIRPEIIKLKKIGLELSILSGDPPATFFAEMNKFGLDTIFDQIKYNIHDKTKAIQAMVKKSNFNADESLFIGDTVHENIVGKKAGCQTCSVTWGYTSRQKLIKHKPTYLISKPYQLSKIICPK